MILLNVYKLFDDAFTNFFMFILCVYDIFPLLLFTLMCIIVVDDLGGFHSYYDP